MGQEMATTLWLVPLPGESRQIELPQGESVTGIGRNPTNAITPQAYYVSRDHCRIRSNLAVVGVAVLEDLSANGTHINGVCVGRGFKKPLKCGDYISLGKPTRPGGAVQFLVAKPKRLVQLS